MTTLAIHSTSQGDALILDGASLLCVVNPGDRERGRAMEVAYLRGFAPGKTDITRPSLINFDGGAVDPYLNRPGYVSWLDRRPPAWQLPVPLVGMKVELMGPLRIARRLYHPGTLGTVESVVGDSVQVRFVFEDGEFEQVRLSLDYFAYNFRPAE